jgi:hypothetical protein
MRLTCNWRSDLVGRKGVILLRVLKNERPSVSLCPYFCRPQRNARSRELVQSGVAGGGGRDRATTDNSRISSSASLSPARSERTSAMNSSASVICCWGVSVCIIFRGGSSLFWGVSELNQEGW